MSKYLLVYHGGSMPETPEAQAAAMNAWTAWFGSIGAGVVDMGNPSGATKKIGAGGAVSDDAGGPSGYSILQADSLDRAVQLAKGCPVLLGGASVQVSELLEIM